MVVCIGSIRMLYCDYYNLGYAALKLDRGWALNRLHNSRWLLDRHFVLCDPVTLTF